MEYAAYRLRLLHPWNLFGVIGSGITTLVHSRKILDTMGIAIQEVQMDIQDCKLP